MASVENLKKAALDAERAAHKLQADRDEAFAKVHARFDDRLRAANLAAADAQKAWLDAEAVDALAGRDDAASVAQALGLSLPADE